MIFIDEKSSGSFLYYIDEQNKGTIKDNDFFKTVTDSVITTSESVKEICNINNIACFSLTDRLHLIKGLSLYEIFSYYYEGKVVTDLDMIEALMKGVVLDSDYCYCLKIGVTFCWFRLEPKIKKLGTMQFSETLSAFSVGRFMKRLRYNLAITGNNLAKVKFLFWNEDDYNIEFSKYIHTFEYLYTYFNRIEGLKELKLSNIIQLLSKSSNVKTIANAENLVNALIDSSTELNITQEMGQLQFNNIYYKDYNNISYNIIDKSKCKYGIILDTEGVKGLDGQITNGVSEIGGIIYCKYNNMIFNVDTFESDVNLIQETLKRVINNYRNLTSTNRGTIPVIVYGRTDILMLNNSNISRKILSTFNFIDCKMFIKQYHTQDDEHKATLTNIAMDFGVKPVYPKHSPVNDAKTLFNILAKILQENNTWLL